MNVAIHIETPIQAEISVPLSKLKKSPRNARRMPHAQASIEALAASIAAKGLLQNLVVEPEVKDGAATGAFFVTAGEGRRLALLLRAKRKEIKKSEPVRCYVDTENDPGELSLDENVTRENLHPADQFEAFRDLAERRGWGAEEIGARFGVSAQVVRQRLRLGAVSPKLLALYRADELNLDQLMAFAITEDHARQEQVYDNLGWNKEPRTIRRDLTASNVPATDRRAIFIGAEAYWDAGGEIIRDLFTEDRGGYFVDAALLDSLVIEKLRVIAEQTCGDEGWKWAEASIDFPHAHGLRRIYPQPVALREEDEARLSAASEEYDALADSYDSFDDMPEEEAAKLEALDKEIDALTARQSVYDPASQVCAGLFVVLNHDGAARIERGFIRPEDEEPPAAANNGEADDADDDAGEAAARTLLPPDHAGEDEEEGAGKPLSDTLVRELTAYRTLGLRLAIGEQPELARLALIHALVADLYHGGDQSCLAIRTSSERLAGHAEGIADSKAGVLLDQRHQQWAAQLPEDGGDLWGFLVGLDSDSRDSLFAHCVAMTINAVKQPLERRPGAFALADTLATAAELDMAQVWQPTTRLYFSRVTKAHIASAVREAVSDEAAERIAPMKKADMAGAAEQLVAPTNWLPALLRTRAPGGAAEDEAAGVDAGYGVAAE